ncbi:MAG: hypothetical protein KGQ87_11675, partial [Verrucomicrobia bacterium]|nr:hypothetical protein [Verrucomicrobiota bacterium]
MLSKLKMGEFGTQGRGRLKQRFYPNSEVEMQTKRALTTDYTDCTDKEKSQKMRSSIISKSAKSVVKMI